MKKLLLFLSLALLCSCTPKSKGFDDITALYKESVEVFKSKDKKKIEAFVEKLLPDDGTIAYMKKQGFSYRGFPEGLKEHPHALDSAKVEVTEILYRYATRLDEYGMLNDLRFISFDREGEPGDFSYEGHPEVLITEPFGVCVSDAKKDTVEYKLGELLKLDGKWKSFTRFKTK